MTFSGRSKKLVNGMVLQRNGRTRAFVVPANPNTTAQNLIRSWFAVISAAWSALALDVQERFNAASTSGAWKLPDPKTGTQRNPTSGKELFQHLNGNIAAVRRSIAAGQLTEMPNPAPSGDTVISSITALSDGEISLAFTGALAANEEHMLSLSPGLSAGTTKFRESAMLYMLSSAAASPIVGTAAYAGAGLVATLAPGSRLCYEVYAVNKVTGQKRLVGKGVKDVAEA